MMLCFNTIHKLFLLLWWGLTNTISMTFRQESIHNKVHFIHGPAINKFPYVTTEISPPVFRTLTINLFETQHFRQNFFFSSTIFKAVLLFQCFSTTTKEAHPLNKERKQVTILVKLPCYSPFLR